MDLSWQPVTGAAQRQAATTALVVRHEQQSIAAALATLQHHSAQRRQKKARAGEEDHEVHFTATFRALSECFAMDVDDVPAAGSRPEWILPVSGPWERVQRHTVEQIDDSAPVVPSLEVFGLGARPNFAAA